MERVDVGVWWVWEGVYTEFGRGWISEGLEMGLEERSSMCGMYILGWNEMC